MYTLSSNLKLDLLWAQLVQLRIPWECHDPNQEPLSTKWLIGLVFAVLNKKWLHIQCPWHHQNAIYQNAMYVWLDSGNRMVGRLIYGAKVKVTHFSICSFHSDHGPSLKKRCAKNQTPAWSGLFSQQVLFGNKYSPYSCYVPQLPF